MENRFSSLLQKWTSISLMLRIFVGLLVGAFIGIVAPHFTAISILGQVFVNALKAVAPVLVAVLVSSSIAKAGRGLGARFKTVITLYLMTTFFAALIAVILSTMFPVTIMLKDAAGDTAPSGLADVFSSLLNNMVANPIQSISSASYIGILFWSIIGGVALKLRASKATIEMVCDFAEVISQVVRWIIQFAPFGIFGLVFSSVSESGLDIFTDYGKLLMSLVGCMLFSYVIVNPFISFLYIHRNPYPLLWKCFRESGLNAFFTRSSAANIPVNMSLCHRMGIDEDFYSVSIPLGSTINMNGAAITITVLSLAVAHTMGVKVNFTSALFLCLIATLGACGASGVAGGSLLLVPMACSFFGIGQDIAMQAVAVGFIIGVVQDSVETALNSSGDAFFTITAEMHDKFKIKTQKTEGC